MITNNTIASYVAVFLVKILIQELVSMGSIHNLDGEIGHLLELQFGSSFRWSHTPLRTVKDPILGPPSAILMCRILKFASSHQTNYKSLGNRQS